MALSQAARGRPSRTQEPVALKVSEEEVLAALDSLYKDQLRPYGRILLRRLGELAAERGTNGDIAWVAVADGPSVPKIDTKHVRRVCERSNLIKVLAEAGSEYVAELHGRAPDFVDASSQDDEYPASLWAALAAFFSAEGAGGGLTLPGGRYACGRALQDAKPPFLEGMSLGRICHIVQLALSERAILGHLDGHTVAYERSEAVVKRRCAERQEPAWALKRDGLPVASLEQVRTGILEMLAGAPQPARVPLPNVKRIFRARLGLELSETAFGHCRVSSLLQDARFRDVCALESTPSGQVVVPAPPRTAERAAAAWALHSGADAAAAHGVTVQRTFLHVPEPSVAEPRRSRSLPRNIAFPALAPAPQDAACGFSSISCSSTSCSGAPSPSLSSPAPLPFCRGAELNLDEEDLRAGGAGALVTPSPWNLRSESPGCVAVSPAPPAVAPSKSMLILATEPQQPSPAGEPEVAFMQATAISLFKSLLLAEASAAADCATEAPESEAESEASRPSQVEIPEVLSPSFAWGMPLQLDEDAQDEVIMPPLATPSPTYDWAPAVLTAAPVVCGSPLSCRGPSP